MIYFVMSETKRSCFINTSPYRWQLSELDIYPDRAGFAVDVLNWPHNPPFSSEPYYCLYLPITGCFKLVTLDEEKLLVPGRIYLIPSGQALRYTGVTPCTHYWCHFYSEKLELLMHGSRIRQISLRGTKKIANRFIQLIELLSTEIPTPSITMKIRNIVSLTVSEFLDGEQNCVFSGYEASSRMTFAAKYIEKNYADKISISNLASLCKMSESLFLKKFKKCYDISPRQYLTRQRLNAARKLLLATPEISVSEAASLCGFENTALFYRCFKKQFNCTPLTFRKNRSLNTVFTSSGK